MQVLILVILRGPFLKLVGVGVGTYFAVRVSDVLTDNLFASLHQDRWFGLIPSHRIAKRISTLSGVVKGIAAVSLVVISGVVGLVLLGVSLGPILASLGFIGLGISLAAQDVIKDTINGLLILMEDQFAEGDVISVEDKGGVVEHMSLRITQLRNTEGNLITIPNSTIKVVENLSNGWSRVDLAILVAYDTDLDYAMRVIETTALKMSRDPKWRDPILEMPQVLGVDDFGELGITLRLWIKVQPLKQWDVAREFRRRLKLAFDQAGIVIPVPLQSVWFMNKLETAQPEVSQDPTG
jgi:small conductance mechanosensitive channel